MASAKKIKKYWGYTNRCFYCEREFGVCHFGSDYALKRTKDHIMPLSRHGSSSVHNMIFACTHCNTSKGQFTLNEWRILLTGGAKDPRLTIHPGIKSRILIIIKNIEKLDIMPMYKPFIIDYKAVKP